MYRKNNPRRDVAPRWRPDEIAVGLPSKRFLDRLISNLFDSPQCDYRKCGESGDYRLILVNASTGEEKEVDVCRDHRDLAREYDRRNRQARRIP